jgi:hypothetical protein
MSPYAFRPGLTDCACIPSSGASDFDLKVSTGQDAVTGPSARRTDKRLRDAKATDTCMQINSALFATLRWVYFL